MIFLCLSCFKAYFPSYLVYSISSKGNSLSDVIPLNPNVATQSKTLPTLGVYVDRFTECGLSLHKVKCSNFAGFISAFY